MKHENKPSSNESYSATVVTIGEVRPIEGQTELLKLLSSDSTLLSRWYSTRDARPVLYTGDALSYEFAYENNLHQHGNLNKDERPEATLVIIDDCDQSSSRNPKLWYLHGIHSLAYIRAQNRRTNGRYGFDK